MLSWSVDAVEMKADCRRVRSCGEVLGLIRTAPASGPFPDFMRIAFPEPDIFRQPRKHEHDLLETAITAKIDALREDQLALMLRVVALEYSEVL